jgi:hypothetical protein
MPLTEQTKQPSAIFPDYPRENPIVDKDGNLTQLWDLGLSSLFQALQDNFKNEGILFPQLTAAEIATIQAIYTPYIGFPLPQNETPNRSQLVIPDISGQAVFDSTNRVPKMFIITYDGATPPNIVTADWKTFTLT